MSLRAILSWLQNPFGINLFQEVSGKSLAVFRIGFGLVMLYELMNMRLYILNDLLASSYFITYDLFPWVRPFPMPVMEFFAAISVMASLFVIIGFKFRVAQSIVAFVWTYAFLMDQGHYNNHYYLYSIVSFVLIFSGANRNYSLDAKLGPKQWSTAVFRVEYLIIQLQVFVVYFFGAVAKMNGDWLAGWPMKLWLSTGIEQFPTWYGDFVTSNFGVMFYSWGGMLFDFSIGFVLFHKKLRYWALPALVFFHVSNHFFWNIGTFPWFSILVTFMYFEPDWPQIVLSKMGFSRIGNLGLSARKATNRKRNWVAIFFTLYIAIQFLAPFRQFIYQGSPGWHGYAQHFAWRMMLVDMVSGVQFRIKDTGDSEFVNVRMEDYITFRQFRKSARIPSSFLDFAHFLGDEMIKGGAKEPVVKMEIYKSFNGRPYALLNDTTVNYARVEETYFSVPNWIQPGNESEEPGQLWEENLFTE
jgi:uncharacterized membrane protein YphA (DoxX/SURF4 family)